MALKSADGRRTLHTQAGHPVCCEQALKSVGERHSHGGCRCGGLRETARAREVYTSGWREEALLGIEGGDLAAGVIHCWQIVDWKCRSLCEWQPLKALRASLRAYRYLNIKYYIVLYYLVRLWLWCRLTNACKPHQIESNKNSRVLRRFPLGSWVSLRQLFYSNCLSNLYP
jgi:hypothetical protein